MTQSPEDHPTESPPAPIAVPARARRKTALPRPLKRLHERLRTLPVPEALDLLGEATTGLRTPEARLLALRLRLRLIADGLDSAQPAPAPVKRPRKPAKPVATGPRCAGT